MVARKQQTIQKAQNTLTKQTKQVYVNFTMNFYKQLTTKQGLTIVYYFC